MLKKVWLPVVLAIVGLGVPLAAQTKLLRFPDIHGEKVVFTYAGDLWTAPTGGGVNGGSNSGLGICAGAAMCMMLIAAFEREK